MVRLLGESETEPAKVYYYPMLLANRLWRRLNIKTTMRQRFVFAIRTPNIANHVFWHLKNIWWINFIFFNNIQLAKLYGAYFCRFFSKKYFTSSDPFFGMYDDRCQSIIIRAVGDIKWNSGKSVYITKKGFPKLKYFSTKNYTRRSPDMLVSWIKVKKNNFSQ